MTTATNTSTFSFAGLELRCVTLEGPGPITVDGKGQAKRSEDPWFVAADVCRILGIGNPTNATRALSDHEVTLQRIKGQRGMPMRCISESGLYKLVMRSDKPQARTFQDFVTGTVLPTIRKTGGYIQGEEKLATGEMTDEQFFALAVLKANTTIELMKAAACCWMS